MQSLKIHLLNFTRIFFTVISIPYRFLESLFFKKKISYIDQELILIGQIQRSGGTLLSQLFDNHNEIFNFPGELTITSPKYDWSKELNFSTVKMNGSLRNAYLRRNYLKLSIFNPLSRTRNQFMFNPYIEKKIFRSLSTANSKFDQSLRGNLNAYFTSFFNSFTNYHYNDNIKKKYVAAFLPRFITRQENIEFFFKNYKKGYIISVLRNPKSWLISAQQHSPNSFSNTEIALNSWNKNFDESLRIKQLYPTRVIIILFESLLDDTLGVMKGVCRNIGIKFTGNLLEPTFNGDFINSDGTNSSVIGEIDKKPLEKKDIQLSVENEKLLKPYIKKYNYFVKNNSEKIL